MTDFTSYLRLGVDSTDAVSAQRDLEKMSDSAENADKSFKKASESSKKMGDSMKITGNFARQAGFQFQDAVVQVQAGQNGFLVFSQQGSQLLSLIHPLVGFAAALAGVIGGALFNSLKATDDAVKNLSDNSKTLTSNLRDLTDAQRETVRLASIEAVNQEIKKNNELTKTIQDQAKQLEYLNKVKGKTVLSTNTSFATSIPGITTGQYAYQIDSSKEIISLTTKMRANQQQQLVYDKQIKELQDPEGATKKIQQLRDQTSLIGLQGDALSRQKGIIEGLTGANLENYIAQSKLYDEAQTRQYIKSLNDETIALDLKNAEIHKNTQLIAELTQKQAKSEAANHGGSPEQQDEIIATIALNKQKQEKNSLDEKSASLFDSQDKAAKDRLLSMQREIDLFGVTSKAAQLEYDIKSGLIKVNGGIASSQAQEMLRRSEILQQLEKQAVLQKSLEDVQFAGYDNTKGDLESAKMQYELDSGILKVNKDLTREYYEQQISNKKLEESKTNQKRIDDLIKDQQKNIAESGMSETEKLQYEIANNILYVEGGINSEKAQQIINNQKIIDSQAKQLELTNSIKDGITEALMRGAADGKNIFENLKGTIEGIFQTMVLKPSLDIATDQLAKSVSSVLGSVGQKDKSGNIVNASGVLGSLGSTGVIAIAAAASVASMWNKFMNDKFEKLQSAYVQANQSTGRILGDANKKSDSINQTLSSLNSIADDALNINRAMLITLRSINEGIGRASALVSRTGVATPSVSGTGTSTLNGYLGASILGGGIGLLAKGVGDLIGGQVGGFINGAIDAGSKLIYSKSKKVIDSGIKFTGQTLADILSTGTVEAFSYASVQTKKKTLGITTSNKVKEQTSSLDDALTNQFALVFKAGGDALSQAATVFGLNFNDYINKLIIDPQKLSLKDLSGDALTKEIQNFFSATLDDWAAVLVGGTDVLKQFQQVGEGAFETIVRLTTEVNTFNSYADALGLNFKLVGVSAVTAIDNIAKFSGGMDTLTNNLSTYYDKFFSDSDKTASKMKSLSSVLSDAGVNVIPANRQAWVDIINSINLATEAGQQQFATLVSYSGAVDDYISAIEKQKKAEEELYKTNVQNAYSALQRSVDAQKKILSDQTQTLNDALSASKSVYSALESSLNGMVISSNKTLELTRKQAQDQLTGFLTSAKSGKTPDLNALNSALSVISQPSTKLFSSFEDYATDFYKTAATIKDLKDITGDTISTDEKSLSELESQTKLLDEISQWGQDQIDSLNGVDNSVKSVADALLGLSSILGVSYPTIEQQKAISEMAKTAEQSRIDNIDTNKKIIENNQNQQNKMNEFIDYIKGSQLAIADNTRKINDILLKFDTIGMPPERTI